ncbi:uncharacterized protein LOC110850106 [Folsomia candida]|uniref:uncharacterized protein LOC110850106 n=1 Tax=Folsomia candida TaxID=158441 RepID=UPI000B8FA23A|nr:uncharacterized protein LOC110850106 [Folsomia candida]
MNYGRIILFIVLQNVYKTLAGLIPPRADPFYWSPVKGNTPLWNSLPFTKTAICEANKTYTIKTIQDFHSHMTDLDCIFSGSRIPTKIPMGSWHGKILTILNTGLFDQLFGSFWVGKYVKKALCNGSETFLGWNAFSLSGPQFPFVPTIGNHSLNLAPLEYDDGRGGLLIQYVDDVMDACPEERDNVILNGGQAGPAGANLLIGELNPLTDVIRFVGKQEDGGNIYLIKTFLTDLYKGDGMSVTIAFTAFLNYDYTAEPNICPGVATEPLAQSYSYTFPGAIDTVLRTFPVDDLFSRTGRQTFRDLRQARVTWGKNFSKFVHSLPFNIFRTMRSGRAWMQEFYSEKSREAWVKQEGC